MKKTIILLILGLSINAFSHGEDKLGPNNGYLKMPANFHTEVVPNKDGTFKIYLLDINFKNPVVKDSKVKVWISDNKKEAVKCEPMKDHFHCFPKGVTLQKGTLTVQAERSLIKGTDAVYKLPLALTKSDSTEPMEDHSKH